jgi:diguanylate cyclase (GGDEF)-like protein
LTRSSLLECNVDPLTGLQNRRGFLQSAEGLLRLADRAEAFVTLGYFDVDGLKQINDDLGHEVGDQAIIEAGRLLGTCFRSADVVARLGGDEFVVLFVVADRAGAGSAADRFAMAVAERNSVGDLPFYLSIASRFIERAPSTLRLDELLSRADAAMYERKRAGRAVAEHS